MNPQALIAALKEALTSGRDFSTQNRSAALREQNKKTTSDVLFLRHPNREVNDETRRLHESIRRRHGIDIFNEKQFPVENSYFSWKKLREKLADKLEEADSASSFTQMLRAGVQVLATNMYQQVETTYEDWVKVVPSGKDTELYAPLHGVAFPREVGRQMKYPEVGAAALDIKLKNKKYGSLYGVEKELLEDDQTGQFQNNARLLGEYLKLLCEALVYGKLGSPTGGSQYIEFKVPTSETQPADETTYPWSQTLVGGGANRPAVFTALTQAGVQAGIIGLMNQKNLLGIKMSVSPTRLLIGPTWKFDAHVLMNSAWYPSGAAATGAVGGAFAVNPIKGILDISVSRFMVKNDGTFNGDSRAWYIVDDSKPWFVLQEREPIAVVQENPLSGESFDRDVYRFKANTRKNADFIDPRFAWQGNDGSV